jgi:hypothetical protein
MKKNKKDKIEELKRLFVNAGCRHEYCFSHYETDSNYEDGLDTRSTAKIVRRYAVMVCRRCGHYYRQPLNRKEHFWKEEQRWQEVEERDNEEERDS